MRDPNERYGKCRYCLDIIEVELGKDFEGNHATFLSPHFGKLQCEMRDEWYHSVTDWDWFVKGWEWVGSQYWIDRTCK